ncbi:MAG: DEAD/DEAH box helicase, partial [Burkholderia sp.]
MSNVPKSSAPKRTDAPAGDAPQASRPERRPQAAPSSVSSPSGQVSQPAHSPRAERLPRDGGERRDGNPRRESGQARDGRDGPQGKPPRPPREAGQPRQGAEARPAARDDAGPDARPESGQAPRPPREPRAPRPPVTPNPVPPITFPESLPVSGKREEIARAIAANQVVIVCGETGSGKTTQLPKICLALGRGVGAGGKGLIGHTQPRRLAASSTGRRIAEELGTPFGEVVGYKVRFTDNLAPGASVKLMTDGILLAETQTDPLLRAYDTLIIDEAHERSLNIDFLLGYLRQILPKRPDLKLIVTSATIDADRFARHFGSEAKPAPVIEVSGRLYPVEVRYRPIADDRSAAVRNAEGASSGRDRQKTAREAERDQMDGIVDA